MSIPLWLSLCLIGLVCIILISFVVGFFINLSRASINGAHSQEEETSMYWSTDRKTNQYALPDLKRSSSFDSQE